MICELEMKLATDARGRPLAHDAIKRLQALLENQTEETWDDAFSINLCPLLGSDVVTLWQAVIAVDPTFPKVGCQYEMSRRGRKSKKIKGWSRIPDRALLERAIRFATH